MRYRNSCDTTVSTGTFTPPDPTPLVVRMVVEYAMSMMDVVRAGDLDRLSYCAADDCDQVVLDLSRNRSRKFCDSGCGNRSNVAAYRARRKRAD